MWPRVGWVGILVSASFQLQEILTGVHNLYFYPLGNARIDRLQVSIYLSNHKAFLIFEAEVGRARRSMILLYLAKKHI